MGLGCDGFGMHDGLGDDGLKTRRWNGTKSAFADCASGDVRFRKAGASRDFRTHDSPAAGNATPVVARKGAGR